MYPQQTWAPVTESGCAVVPCGQSGGGAHVWACLFAIFPSAQQLVANILSTGQHWLVAVSAHA